MPKIKVHRKALAHLSRGLYRSPASALRELISNAWDAGATIVRINTNYPNFFQISVEDNGDGFSLEEFENMMEGGIGNSTKRDEEQQQSKNRPTIGRLGIGLLGIAQICGSFSIASSPKIGKKFSASIRLFDLLKDRLDSNDNEIVEKEEGPIREVNVGEYEILKDGEAKIPNRGTRIVSIVVHPTFTDAFQKSLTFEKFKEPPNQWDKALKIVSGVHTLQELGDYWRLLWELSASSPIPYLKPNSLPHGLIKEENHKLSNYNFKVVIDGTELKKPISLRGNPGGYTYHKITEQKKRVYGKDLIFHGYILVQEGKQIKPDELRGILIRIKNIAIGYYDPSMLDYRYNEGPRAKWVTGEIYVDDGLEDALNIDRDTFNRFHPEFRALQEFVHQILHEKIFPEVYRQIDVRSSEKQSQRNKERKSHLKTVIQERKGAKVSFQNTTNDKITRVVHKKGKAIKISLPTDLEVKKSNRALASAILTIFEVALQERNIEKQRELFKELLLGLLTKW